MTIHAKWQAWPNQARRRPAVDGRRRAWCEWALRCVLDNVSGIAVKTLLVGYGGSCYLMPAMEKL